MKWILRFGLMGLMLLCGSNISAAFLEILSPPPLVSTLENELYLIGRTDALIVEVFINGEKYSDHLVKDSVFHVHLFFGSGINEVQVKAIKSGQQLSQQLVEQVEILSSFEVGRKMLKLYPKYKFHTDDNPAIGACVDCHKSDLKQISENNDEAGCVSCHTALKDKFKKHTEVDDRTCINCHELGENLVSAIAVADDDNNPCFRCHKEKVKEFGQEFIHGPVAGGSCTICHEPHGSVYDHSLVNPEQILCTSCHEDIEDEFKKKNKHQPFDNGYCGECHDPHSTSNRWVLLKRSEAICMNCHDITKDLKWHDHPYNVKPKKKLQVKLDLNDKGHLECISCHHPHASNSAHLLRITADFTCIGCHADLL